MQINASKHFVSGEPGLGDLHAEIDRARELRETLLQTLPSHRPVTPLMLVLLSVPVDPSPDVVGRQAPHPQFEKSYGGPHAGSQTPGHVHPDVLHA